MAQPKSTKSYMDKTAIRRTTVYLRSSWQTHAQDLAAGSRFGPSRLTSQLATVFKERLQELCAAACQDSASDLCLVIQLRMIEHLQN